jgi:dimethylargininase
LFKNAIVRTPGHNFAGGLTTVDLGAPQFNKVLEQHALYCEALQLCGLQITTLDPDLQFPDSTFVEDTAVLTSESAILTNPGAHSREGEVAAIAPALSRFFSSMPKIESPGTLDGGDICEAENHFFIGLSHRTNEEGARQLAAYLLNEGYTSSCIDVRAMTSILHLKSGVSYIGENTLVVMEEMAAHVQFSRYNRIRVPVEETYAANCIRVNDRVLFPAEYPHTTGQLRSNGFHPLLLDMSEFQKMDGGLSCLSLRF